MRAKAKKNDQNIGYPTKKKKYSVCVLLIY